MAAVLHVPLWYNTKLKAWIEKDPKDPSKIPHATSKTIVIVYSTQKGTDGKSHSIYYTIPCT